MDHKTEAVQFHPVPGNFLGLILQREAHVEASHSPQAFACTKAKDLFSQRFPGVGQKYFTDLTVDLLDRIYPKSCPHCETPLSLGVKNRENAVRCPQCFFQGSRTAYTPLHHLKLPLWVFGFLFAEAMYRYPAVLSGSEIRRRLGVSSRTALLLKRRLQLFFSDLMPAVREEFKEELEKRFQNFDLPEEGEDVSAITAVRPVLNMDTVALFSASQRANGGRSRHRHTGQTASIYLSDKVAEEKGKYQIGTLCHTMAIKNGPVILDCIPDQKQRTIQPLLNFLPSQVPIFTDEGYPWLSKYNKNHRAVNHSARAKDKKRNVWGRNRWCKKGIHNQAAEGFQRNLKHSFIAGYSYVTPQFAPLYLNEYAGIKSLKHYGLDTIATRRLKMVGRGECDQGTVLTFSPSFPTNPQAHEERKCAPQRASSSPGMRWRSPKHKVYKRPPPLLCGLPSY